MVSCLLLAGALGLRALDLAPVGSEVRAGRCCEFRVVGAAPPSGNPFDPDAVLLDAVFSDPSGKPTRVPAFWKQEFTRSLTGGSETLHAEGEPGWRVRFTPWEPGTYRCEILLGEHGATPSPAGSTRISRFTSWVCTFLTTASRWRSWTVLLPAIWKGRPRP